VRSRGAMASEAFVENLMAKMNTANVEAIAKIMETISLNQRGSSGGMVDNRGVGRPISFKGDANKFAEWVAKLHAYVRSSNPLASKWLEEASVATEMIDDSMYGANVQDFSIKLHATMISCAEEDPFKIANSVQSGLEAFRLLKKRYEPRTPGAKRALSKAIINNPQSKKIGDIEKNLMHVEGLIKRYENMTEGDLPEDLKVTIYIDLCQKDLREHLELSTKELDLKGVRDEILNYIERKRDVIWNNIKAMEVDHFESDRYQGYGDWAWYDENEYEELNYFQKGGEGGKGGEGKGYYYGGKGGYEKGGGEGKGFEGKGSYEKGEGKGKGFQGERSWCGIWGHTAAECIKKDKRMRDYRQANGIPEPVWPPAGEGGLHSCEEYTEKPTKPITSESPAMALDATQSLGGYRLLRSLDAISLKNRYADLQREEDTCPRGLCNNCHEGLPPGLWPRLQGGEVPEDERKEEKLFWRAVQAPAGV
jgi:hypothetical protein